MKFTVLENLIVLVFIIVLVVIFWRVIRNGKGTAFRVQRVKARLLSKVVEQEMDQTAFRSENQIQLGVVEKRKAYKVSFQRLDTDRILEFEINPQLYESLQEGTEDILLYRGDKLIRFGVLQNYEVKSGGRFITGSGTYKYSDKSLNDDREDF